MVKTQVNIFPYTYRLSGIENTASILAKKFSSKNVKDNPIPYSDTCSLIFIVDQYKNDFLYGKFVRFRRDIPNVLDMYTGEVTGLSMDKNKGIIEESHFLMNVKAGIIFAQYNFHALRMFSTPAKFYFDTLFGTDDNSFEPIDNIDTYNDFKKEQKLQKFELGITKANYRKLEKKFNLSALDVFGSIADDEESMLVVEVRRSRKKDSSLNTKQIFELTDGLLRTNKEDIRVLRAESKNEAYNLLKGNLLSYFIEVDFDNRTIYSQQIYNETKKLYDDKITGLRATISKN